MKAAERFDLKKDLLIKLRFILLPFLIGLALVVASYSYLRYLVDIKYELISISGEFYDIWIPFFLTAVIWFFFVRKRFRFLKANWNSTRDIDFFHGIAILLIVGWLVGSQMYLVERFSKIETAEYLLQITEFHKNDYYKIEEVLYDKSQYGVYYSAKISGRYNQDLNYYANFVVPIKVAYSNDKYWLGVHYSESLRTNDSDAEKDKIWKHFTDWSWQDFLRKDLNNYKYLRVVPPSDQRKEYELAVANSELGKLVSKDDLIIFRGVTDSYASRYEDNELFLLYLFWVGSPLFIIAMLFTHVVPKKFEEFITDKPEKSNDFQSIIGYIIPQGSHFSTSLLSIINVSVFVLMVATGVGMVHPLPNELMEFGALRRAEVLDGQYWRLLTSEFIHVGIFHLAMNLVGFIMIGIFVESAIGRWRMIVLYISTAIGASLLSIWFHENTISAGASGAIMGMVGYMIAATILRRRSDIAYPYLIFIFGPATFIVGFISNADNAGHLGGLLTGIIVGFIMLLNDKDLEGK